MNDEHHQFILSFGNRVRTLRLNRGFSQQYLANCCDFELSQLNRIELGKINTSIKNAKIIADSLGVDIRELFNF